MSKYSVILATDVDGIGTVCQDCRWANKTFEEEPCCKCQVVITGWNMSEFKQAFRRKRQHGEVQTDNHNNKT